MRLGEYTDRESEREAKMIYVGEGGRERESRCPSEFEGSQERV